VHSGGDVGVRIALLILDRKLEYRLVYSLAVVVVYSRYKPFIPQGYVARLIGLIDAAVFFGNIWKGDLLGSEAFRGNALNT